MTIPRDPRPPSGSDWTEEDQRLRASMANELPPRPSRFEDEDLSQPDPELAEGRAGTARIVVYAIAALLIVGVVLYGMGHNDTNTASNPPASTSASNTPANPRTNTQPGTTTGAAPGSPAQPTNPAAAGPGSTSR